MLSLYSKVYEFVEGKLTELLDELKAQIMERLLDSYAGRLYTDFVTVLEIMARRARAEQHARGSSAQLA